MAETTVYLSLGSNIGDRENNLRRAIAALTEARVRVTRVSSFYETEPVDLRELRGIEAHMGSEKLVPKGPRLIDIDILLYGDATVDRPELQVPHPRMLQRRFVLVPLAEIAPNLKHPSWAGTAKQIVSNLADSSAVHKFEASI